MVLSLLSCVAGEPNRAHAQLPGQCQEPSLLPMLGQAELAKALPPQNLRN